MLRPWCAARLERACAGTIDVPNFSSFKPSRPLRTAAFVATVVAGGCRSGAQTDIVEREMRHQEDQIYALQDDLSNYQQLVCQYRSENEALKHQLYENQTSEVTPATKNDHGMSRLKPSPQTPMPPSQKSKGPSLGEPETSPPTPQPNLGEPEVPPLGNTSTQESGSQQSNHRGIVARSATPTSVPREHQVSYEAADRAGSTEGPISHPAPAVESGNSLDTTGQAEQVILRGQVVAKEAEAWPRVLVDVEPISLSGEPAAFRGSLSLMVLDPCRVGYATSVARWDFSAEDLEHATVRTTEGTALEFPLQLPPGTATAGPVELWVRLLRDDGRKLLAHATIDLRRAGEFCSAGRATLPTVARAVQVVDTSLPSMDALAGAVRKTDWQVARPDDPASPASNASEPTSGWRTATQPIPMAPQAAEQYASPQPPINRASTLEPVRETKSPAKMATRAVPDWSPERTEGPKPEVPDWAPTR
jgi:hypothetical protein